MVKNDNKDDFSNEIDLLFLASDVTRLFGTVMDRLLRHSDLDLSPAQWRVITHVYHRDGQTQTALAEWLGMEKAPLGSLIDKLEKTNLVERRPAPNDRRAKLIYITKLGTDLLPIIETHANLLLSQATTDISEKHLSTTCATLTELRSTLLSIKEKGIN
jgi:MarR family transcriptional regulator for hemolysin